MYVITKVENLAETLIICYTWLYDGTHYYTITGRSVVSQGHIIIP